MAITESAETQPGSGEPPASGPLGSRARARWRRWTPVRWIPTVYYRGQSVPTSGSPVAGLSLAPSESILVGIPVRMAGACYDPNGWTGPGVFYVKERFLFFTHWVTVTVQRPWIMHEPFTRSQQAARGLPCLSP